MQALFPFINPRKGWKQVNLDEEFQKYKNLNMKNIEDQKKLLNIVSENDTFYTFGGFREDRSMLWEGFEGDNKMIHLGVDFNNLELGDIVASLSDGIVIDILVDITPFNGWGTKIIVEDENFYYLYGHLMNPFVKKWEKIKKGHFLGVIASPEKNGGWFPHLHLQVMNKKELNVNIREVDGYEFVEGSVKGVVNPCQFLSL